MATTEGNWSAQIERLEAEKDRWMQSALRAADETIPDLKERLAEVETEKRGVDLTLDEMGAVMRACEQRAESRKFPLADDDLAEYRLLEAAGVKLTRAILKAEREGADAG